MPKTQFTKGQLVQIYRILREEKLLPCEKISVFTDIYNSGKEKYNIMRFVKGKTQLDIGLITRTYPKNEKLTQQLYEYFGEDKEIKNLIEEATERRIEKICNFHWRRIFREKE